MLLGAAGTVLIYFALSLGATNLSIANGPHGSTFMCEEDTIFVQSHVQRGEDYMGRRCSDFSGGSVAVLTSYYPRVLRYGLYTILFGAGAGLLSLGAPPRHRRRRTTSHA